MPRIHILGASGSGTTTLGALVAGQLSVRHLDTDAFYWMPTDPPFTTKRPVPERLALLAEQMLGGEGWVLSGSAIGWGKPLEPLYDLIVYLRLDPSLRMRRLRRREKGRYGPRIEAGGDMEAASAAFLIWAAAYDTAGREQRSLVAHEEWLSDQKAPVLRLASCDPPDALANAVLRAVQVI
jgi:adenylate kinase family enzyme